MSERAGNRIVDTGGKPLPEDETLPELQVGAYSETGLQLSVSFDGQTLPLLADELQRDDGWSRAPLTFAQMEAMRSGPVLVEVACEVGEWKFRLPPSYMRGFEAALARNRLELPGSASR